MLLWVIVLLLILICFSIVYLNISPSVLLYYDLKTNTTTYKNDELSKLYVRGALPTLNKFDVKTSVDSNSLLYYLAKYPKATNTCYVTEIIKMTNIIANPTTIPELSAIVYTSILSNRVNSNKISLKIVRDYFLQHSLVPRVDLNDLIELYRWDTLKINVGQNQYYQSLINMIGEGAVPLNFDLYAQLIYRLSRNVRPLPTIPASIDLLESNKLEPITLSPRNVLAQTTSNAISWDGLEFYTGTKKLYFPGIKHQQDLEFHGPIVKTRGTSVFHIQENEYLLAQINSSLVYIGKQLEFETAGVIQSNVENSGPISKTIVLNLNVENGTTARKIKYLFESQMTTIAVSEWVSYKITTLLYDISVNRINATELSLGPKDAQHCVIAVFGDSIPTITKDTNGNFILDGTIIDSSTLVPSI